MSEVVTVNTKQGKFNKIVISFFILLLSLFVYFLLMTEDVGGFISKIVPEQSETKKEVTENNLDEILSKDENKESFLESLIPEEKKLKGLVITQYVSRQGATPNMHKRYLYGNISWENNCKESKYTSSEVNQAKKIQEQLLIRIVRQSLIDNPDWGEQVASISLETIKHVSKASPEYIKYLLFNRRLTDYAISRYNSVSTTWSTICPVSVETFKAELYVGRIGGSSGISRH